MKKIDKLANAGLVVKSGKWTFVATITYQGDGGTVEVGGLGGRCVAYLEEGFLVDDGEKWRFHDAEGKLVASARKAALGECPLVSGMGDFYVFQKPKNGGKTPDSVFCASMPKGSESQRPVWAWACRPRRCLPPPIPFGKTGQARRTTRDIGGAS